MAARLREDFPDLKVGYSSHGSWAPLSTVRELETERGNEFPEDLPYPGDTPAVWVAANQRAGLRYVYYDQDENWDRHWERLSDPKARLTKRDRRLAKELYKIELRPTDVIIQDDGDDGYLVLRPES